MQSDSSATNPLARLLFEDLHASVSQNGIGLRGRMSLGNVILEDRTTEDTKYPTLVQAKNAKDELSNHELEKPFFVMDIEHNPLDGRVDDAVSIEMLPLEVIYNPDMIRTIADFFSPPASEAEAISSLQVVAQSTFEGLTAQTAASLQYALEQHRTIDLKVDVAAPIFLFPIRMKDGNPMVVLVDAGHFTLESNYVDKHRKKELQANYKSLELDELKDLLYDRFTCKLSSVQALVGPSVSACVAEATYERGQTDLHFVEKVDLSLVVQLCILSKVPDLPRTKISARLPGLHMNFSDRKYRVIMDVLDSMARAAPVQQLPARREVASEALQWNFLHNNSLPMGLMLEDGDSFYDAPEEMLSDAQSDRLSDSYTGTERVQFEAVFEVEQASMSLMKSADDIFSPDTPLAMVNVDMFALSIGTTTNSLSVSIGIKTITVEDQLEHESEFPRLFYPSTRLDTSTAADSLISVKYRSLKPDFVDYAGVDQSLEISFAAVTVVLSSRSIITLYDLIIQTFTEPRGVLPVIPEVEFKEAGDTDEHNSTSNDPTIDVNASLTGITFVVHRNGNRLATARFGELKSSLRMKGASRRIIGSVGDLSVRNDMPNEHDNHEFPELLRIEGEKVAQFTWETYSPLLPSYPGYDVGLSLEASSLVFTFLEPLLRQLILYFNELRVMQLSLDNARPVIAKPSASVDHTDEGQSGASKFHFDIHVNTPIIIFPRGTTHNKDALYVYPGSISAKNEFLSSAEGYESEISAHLREMKMVSVFMRGDGAPSQQILADINLELRMRAAFAPPVPNLLNIGISEVRVALTSTQYTFLLKLIHSLNVFYQQNLNAAPEQSGEKVVAPSSIFLASPVNVTPTFVLKGETPLMCLELLQEHDHSVRPSTTEVVTPLAEFAMNKLTFEYQGLSDGSSNVRLQVQSLSMEDRRNATDTKFREIMMFAGKDDNQLVATSHQRAGETCLELTLRAPTIIIAPDYVFLIRDFFVAPLQEEGFPGTDAQLLLDAETTIPHDDHKLLVYHIELVDVQLILLHQAASASTEALALSSKRLTISQEKVMQVLLEETGLTLCQMDSREQTSVPLVQTFDLGIAYENRVTSPGHTYTTLTLDLSHVLLRSSYRDMLVMADIVDNILSLSGSQQGPRDALVPEHEANNAETALVMARERFRANFKGFRLVAIDDLNDLHLPMLDLLVEKFTLDAADWSSLLRIESAPSLCINYFNVKNSHWEPLVEQWQVFVNVARQAENGTLSVDVQARKRLDINITHTFVESLLSTMHLWSKQEKRTLTARRGKHAPYVIRNRTGYDMFIWADSDDTGLDTDLQNLVNGEDLPWRFEDWRSMRERMSPIANRVSLQLKGPSWETTKGVTVDREGQTTYILRPAINRVTHRLVCDVRLKDNVKIVTFRSGLEYQNDTEIPIEIRLLKTQQVSLRESVLIGPGDCYHVPIEDSYSASIQIRPKDFGWSAESISWRDIHRLGDCLISCRSMDPTAPSYRFHISCTPVRKMKEADYPMLHIKIMPPILLENLLPYRLRFVLHDKSTRQQVKGVLEIGEARPMHVMDPTHILALQVEILDSAYRPSELAIITNSEIDYRDDTLRLADLSGQQLLLRIKYGDKSNAGRRVSIYSPYVLLNKTGLDMRISAGSLLGVSRHDIPAVQDQQEVKPLMFSFPTFEPIKSRVQISIPPSKQSKPISLDAVGSSFVVVVCSQKDAVETHLGATITEGDGKFFMTKIVTFTPRFILKNKMDEDIYFKLHGAEADEHTLLRSKSSYPVDTLNVSHEGVATHLRIRLPGLMSGWSNPFDITQIGRIYIKSGKISSPAEEDLIRAEVQLQDATVFVIFAARETKWPFRIQNETNVDLVMWQMGASNRFTVPRLSSRSYAWDLPSHARKTLMLSANGREREIDVLEIGQRVPMRYPAGPTNHAGVMSIQVAADGPVLVVRMSPYEERKSLFRKASARPSSVSSSKDAKLETFKMKEQEPHLLVEMQVKLEGIGLSLVNKNMHELLYASAKNVALVYTDTSDSRAYSFNIKWLQVDNQLYGGLEPIFLYPTVLPREGEEDYRPFLMITLSKSKDTSYGVEYYNWFTILLQELSVDLDEDFLLALINVFKFNIAGWVEPPSQLCDTRMSIPEPAVSNEETRLYFDKFLLQPVQINVSFVRTQASNLDEARPRHHGLLSFVVDVLTMTLGNIHDAPLRLNVGMLKTNHAAANASDRCTQALELVHPNMTSVQLIDSITRTYSQELIGQIHKVVGSADFLGNPVGLFNNVSSGVSDFFYEPLQGFEITRPQDFGIGVAKGTASLFRKTIFGVSDTFSKFTGSLGKGLSVITMDSKFQERRRLSSIRNRPRHAVYGVTTGATSLARSVASGITGVVSKPLEGAQEEGVGGFFKGLGKGIVGVVTKPVIGVIDLATNVGEGIRNTTTVFDAELDRQRLPRHIGKDKILTPYSSREALGLSWLKGLDSGRYFREQYIAHLDLRIEDLVAIATDARVVMARIKRLKTEWEIAFDELQSIRMENGGITLVKREKTQAKFRIIPCPDGASCKAFCSKIEGAFGDYIEQLRPYD
ncbi:hypothetical protein BC832DRAFT_588068 [Gaertneriomyces semiglobifer]|nr:hypothetical protein BC832DRAFT_588068 [Gaertneriomyces semiglobifer]